jgi:hypothetical protein
LYDGISERNFITSRLRSSLNGSRFELEYKTNDVSIVRSFNSKDKSVDHAFYKIKNPDLEGKSSYKPVFLDQLALYKKLGYETINIHADIDVGCWAWGKYGFKYTEMDDGYNFRKLAKFCNSDDGTIKNYFKEDSYFYDNCLELRDDFNVAEKDLKDFIIKEGIGWQGYIDLTDQIQIEKGIEYAKKPKKE